MSTTIRVSTETRNRFARLAASTGRPMTVLLDEAADALERRVFFSQLTSRYSELRDDPETWSEVQEERTIEGIALHDQSK